MLQNYIKTYLFAENLILKYESYKASRNWRNDGFLRKRSKIKEINFLTRFSLKHSRANQMTVNCRCDGQGASQFIIAFFIILFT